MPIYEDREGLIYMNDLKVSNILNIHILLCLVTYRINLKS